MIRHLFALFLQHPGSHCLGVLVSVQSAKHVRVVKEFCSKAEQHRQQPFQLLHKDLYVALDVGC